MNKGIKSDHRRSLVSVTRHQLSFAAMFHQTKAFIKPIVRRARAQASRSIWSGWFSLSSSSTMEAFALAPATATSLAFLEPPEEALLTLRSGFLALESFFSGEPSLSVSVLSAERVRLRPGVSTGLEEETLEDFFSSLLGDIWSSSCGPRIVDRKSRAGD